MPESSQPPHSTDSPVSTVARLLATVALLHGSNLDGSDLNRGNLDRETAAALVDAVAYLTNSGDTDGADRLLRLVTTDPDTLAAAHVALNVPARRPTPAPDSTAGIGALPPPLPRRIPRPYRDPGTRDHATPPGTTSGPGPRPAGTAGTAGDAALLSETRRWREATTAQVLSLDYAVTGADGRLTGVYTPVPIVHPPGWCDHLDTICAGCLTGWSEDHAVAVFRHGPHGAAEGCRCPVCRTTIPTHPDGPAGPNPSDHSPAGPSPTGPGLTGSSPAATAELHRGGSTGRDPGGEPGWFGEEKF